MLVTIIHYGLSIGTELGDVEWPWTAWWPSFCIISPNSVALRRITSQLFELDR